MMTSTALRAERALTLGTVVLMGIAALVTVRGLFHFFESGHFPLIVAIPISSAACAAFVFYLARRYERRFVSATLLSAPAVGCVNFLFLLCFLPGASGSLDLMAFGVVMSWIGAAFGFAFGLALLPVVFLARLERRQPTQDWLPRVALVLAVYTALIIVLQLGLLRDGAGPEILHGISGAFGIVVVLSLITLARDLQLLRLLRDARHGKRGLRLRERGNRPLPLLFRPVAMEPYDTLVQVKTMNSGPFRDERTERTIAWVPRGAPRAIYIRVACASVLLVSASAILIDSI